MRLLHKEPSIHIIRQKKKKLHIYKVPTELKRRIATEVALIDKDFVMVRCSFGVNSEL